MRLFIGVLLCALTGSSLASLTNYHAEAATMARHWFYLLGFGAVVSFGGAVYLLLREWRVEDFARNGALTCALVFAGLNFWGLCARGSGQPENAPPNIAQIILGTLALQGAGLVLTAWFLHRNGQSWAEAFGLRQRPGNAALRGLLLGVLILPLLLVLQWLAILLLQKLHLDPKPQRLVEVLRQLQSLPVKVYLVFAAMVLAPVTEEILFRGIFYTWLKRLAPRWIAMLTTAILFGVLHQNLASFFPLVVFGACLCALYDRTGNLVAPMAAHACFNACNAMLLVVSQFLRPDSPPGP